MQQGLLSCALMITHRRAVRAILLTPDREVLLMRVRPPDGAAAFWITPGGGMEPGETPEACLRRELTEELGLADFIAGPILWRRHHTFDGADRRISQREEYRIVHVERFAPVMSDTVEAAVLDGFKWWTLAELNASDERLTPLSLANILERYLAEGPPVELPDEEVLFD